MTERTFFDAAMTDDDKIVRARISGRSVSTIAKTRRMTVAEVNEAIDCWADSTITDKTRKRTLALEPPGSTSFRRSSTSAPWKATCNAARR
jgi:hypothetical protein